MATVIKLTDKVTEKLSYLKDLAGVDDSIIDQETKKEIASAVSTIEQEITKIDTAKPAKMHIIDEDAKWSEPEINPSNLLPTSLIYDSYGFPAVGYSRYGICFKDFSNRVAPQFRNVISAIYDNLDYISSKNYEQLAETMLLDVNNPLSHSGLFIYKMPTDEYAYDHVPFSDVCMEVWIPMYKEAEMVQYVGKSIKFNPNINMYPNTFGYLLDFNSIKTILLDPEVIATAFCMGEPDSIYRFWHLYRDKSNNNFIIAD